MSDKKWSDGVNAEDVAKHYGYEDSEEAGVHQGFWRKESVPERFKKISELPIDWSKKVQVIFEYDPNFQRAYIRAIGLKN